MKTPPQIPQTPPPPDKWSVMGSCFDEKNPATPIPHCTLSFPQGNSVTVLDSGTPIDTALAVHFIVNFHDKIKIFQETQAGLHNAMHVDSESFDKAEALRLHQVHHEQTNELVGQFMKIAYGITFDKSLILRIFSQPKCEAIRCYFCAKENTNPDLQQPYVLSIVVTGVDGSGNELTPIQPPDELFKPLDGGGTGGDDGSLTGEYGSPPDGSGSNRFGDKRYGLLHMAKLKMDADKAAVKSSGQTGGTASTK